MFRFKGFYGTRYTLQRKGSTQTKRTQVIPAVKEKDERVVHPQKLSYFSRLAEAERFQFLSLVEVQRRGIENSREVAMLGDGAQWIQHLADYHCQDSLRILDFPHGGQRVAEMGQVLWGIGTPESSQWISNKLHQLKHEGPVQLLVELSALNPSENKTFNFVENSQY